MIASCVLCDNTTRMGFQNTTNARDAFMIVWLFLCKNIARMGLQTTTNAREMHWWSSDVFSVTILQGWVYKTQQTREMHASNQTCLLWQYCNDGLTKTQQTFHAFMIVWCFLCNNVARMGVQNTTNTRDACEQSDVFFVKILQGWAYKTQQTVSNTRDALMIVWCMRLY